MKKFGDLDDHPDTRAQIESLAHDGPGPYAELERQDLSDRVASRSIICVARMAT